MKRKTRHRLGFLVLGAAGACLATVVGILAHEVAAWLAELLFVSWDWPPRSPRFALADSARP